MNSTDPTRELVPPAGEGAAVIRQRISGEVGAESLRAVIEFDLMISGAGHPGSIRGRSLYVVAKIGPHRRLRRRIHIRVTQIAIEQVKQRFEAFHRFHGVATLGPGQRPGHVRSRKIAVAGPAKGRATGRRSLETRRERLCSIAIIIGGDRVVVGGSWPESVNPRVVGEHRTAVNAVRIRALDSVDHAAGMG